MLSIPQNILMPVVLGLCVVGAYGENGRVFDIGALFFFGLLGYLMIKFGFPLTPLVLGFILGPLLETNLRRGLMLSQGDFYAIPDVTDRSCIPYLHFRFDWAKTLQWLEEKT